MPEKFCTDGILNWFAPKRYTILIVFENGTKLQYNANRNEILSSMSSADRI